MNGVAMSGPLGQSGASVAGLREHNLSSVLSVLARHGTLTRAEIAGHCGLRVSALTNLVQELRDRGLVEETDGEQPAMGRPVRPISLARRPWVLLAIQCDRTRILAAIGNLTGELESVHEFPVPEYSGLAEYLPHLDLAVRGLLDVASRQSRPVLALEVGVPGAANRERGTVVRSVLNGWSEGPLGRYVEEMLAAAGSTAVVGVDRETNYSMLSCISGSEPALDDKSVAYIGGRGAVSGGLFSRSTVEHGSGGLAGEFGHIVIDPGGRQCWCGRRGCAETRLGLASIYSQATGADYATVMSGLSSRHEAMTAELRELLDGGDKRTAETFADAGRWLGITIDTVAGVVNPELFIVNGFLAEFRRGLETEMRGYLDGIGGLPSITRLDVDFGPGAPHQMLRGMVLAGRSRVIGQPALAAVAARMA
ncbi:ROK family transcriptional regulator [Arthrobacter cavernae]|uniref:ROK family transcriptional regulator n=1 Tax=Arthrobacter cavernae TaxID=2817681 RepID=A0A939HC95_9MICC|nr:ROK family transcriptional regulator [Arthrobacter cavernae]MBO1268194.1 ROK family transcriptional regulator [Arthrobacter cavernae]